jgi:small subunit ribosomal protein S6
MDKPMTRKYELMVIMKPLLPDNVRKNIQDKIAKLISDGNGKIVEKEVWGKKYLAYEIKKQNEGYYIVYQITLSPDALDEIKKEFDLTGEILRYLFVKK